MNTFGNKLKELMQETKTTQRELAKSLGVERGSISNWVTGKRTPDAYMMTQIAEYFNVTVDFLLKGNNDKNLKNVEKDIQEIRELYVKYSKLDSNNKVLIDAMIMTMLEKQKDKGN